MPVKTDDMGNRSVEMAFIARGTPEQLWQLMATGPGMTAWFTPTTVEERVGGKIRFEFGPDVSSSGEVTIWEPPHRFGYVEREWMEGAPPCDTEINIERRSGGRCVVRMIHRLSAASDDWDDQLEGFENGWAGFFVVLRTYLAHFAGQKGAAFQIMVPGIEGDDLAIWTRMTKELGIAGANVGERRTNGSEPEAFAGVVEHAHQDDKVRFTVLRLEAPGPGIIIVGTYRGGGRTHASLTRYCYGEDAAAAANASEGTWRKWFSENFPAGAAS